MKMKWKIVLASISMILVLTATIITFTYIEVKKLVRAETNDVLKQVQDNRTSAEQLDSLVDFFQL